MRAGQETQFLPKFASNRDFSRTLLQSQRGSENRTSDFIGLSVLIAVCLLFLLNICLCVYKLIAGEEDTRDAARRNTQPRLARLRNTSIPVIFVNPGGSVRIGHKLKRSDSDPVDTRGEPSTPPTIPNDIYLLREVDVDLETGASERFESSRSAEGPVVQPNNGVRSIE